ncbi:MAG: hypothetical protein L0Z62_26335 [Gemmataceae bacterium]|nr:hypothetical protein [Gemmataceae bacterium]
MFHVEWLQQALDDLADAWVQADSAQRQAITAASDEVDQRLQSDPHNEGESRAGGRRILFVPPLAATYRIEADGKTVTVVQIRVFRKRR